MNIFTVKMWVLYHNQDKGAWSPIKPEGHNAEISQVLDLTCARGPLGASGLTSLLAAL